MAAPKPKSMDEYIATFPDETKIILEQTRARIKKIVPTAQETISYGIPTFKLNGVYVIYFAAYKNHIGFYATPAGHEEFKEELSQYKQGKGSVQFPINQPMPNALITRIIKFRVQEIMKKTITKIASKKKTSKR